MDKLEKNKKQLLKNTVFLYLLTFSNYLFSFLTVPYQTRILGASIYGKIGFAASVVTYFQLIIDFGFILSATEEVARNRDDKKKLGQILTSVNICKSILVLISGSLLILVCLTIDTFREDYLLHILYFLSIVVNCFMPDFLYRGIEDMKVITYRSVAVKFFFMLMIFVLLKDKSQYYLVPILSMIGSLGALMVVYYDVYKRLGIRFQFVGGNHIVKTLKKSSIFFYSRIAGTIHSVTNTFILGMIYPGAGIVGLFSCSDRLISTAKSAFEPISDSLYPYMVKNKDFKLVKKTLFILMPLIIIGSIIVGVFAPQLCAFIFGSDFKESGNILRYLLPVLVATLPNYILGFPVLSPVGLAKYANYSVIFGATIQILNVLLLFIFDIFSVYTLCIVTSITEISILLFRILVIYRNRNLFSNSN